MFNSKIIENILRKLKPKEEEIIKVIPEKNLLHCYLISPYFLCYYKLSILEEIPSPLIFSKDIKKYLLKYFIPEKDKIIFKDKFLTSIYLMEEDVPLPDLKIPEEFPYVVNLFPGLIYAGEGILSLDGFIYSPFIPAINRDIVFPLEKRLTGTFRAALTKDFLFLKKEDLIYILRVREMPDSIKHKLKEYKATVRQLLSEDYKSTKKKQERTLLDYLNSSKGKL